MLYRAGTVHLEDVSQCVPPDQISLKKVEMEGLGDVPGILVTISGIFFTLTKTTDEQGLQARFEQEMSARTHAQVVARASQVIADLEWTTKDLALRKSDLEMSVTGAQPLRKSHQAHPAHRAGAARCWPATRSTSSSSSGSSSRS